MGGEGEAEKPCYNAWAENQTPGALRGCWANQLPRAVQTGDMRQPARTGAKQDTGCA